MIRNLRAEDASWLRDERYDRPLESYPLFRKCYRPLHQRFERPEPWLEHVKRHMRDGAWFELMSMDTDRTGTLQRARRSAIGGLDRRENPMRIEVVATKNGPYLLSGDLGNLDLRDGDGNLYNASGKSRIFLCRCGASTAKPFCDGQHTKIGFAAAEAAVGTQG